MDLSSAQFGPHRWSAGHHDTGHNGQLRGAVFEVMDMRGARLVDCDLTGARVVDGWLVDVRVDGYVQDLRVNGVDVTAFVSDELDRRHPERVLLREARTPAHLVAVWDTAEALWADLLSRFPSDLVHRRVQQEWSLVETLRHLVFCTDSWLSRTVLDVELPFHELALPQTAYSPVDAAALGMHVDAQPSLDVVLRARADRQALVRETLAGLDDAELTRICTRAPAPGYPEEERTVADCVGVVLQEEVEHYRFASRDLQELLRS